MTTFVLVLVLVPGAGGDAWYWHRVLALLRGAGHDTVAVNLPGADETAGLPEYTSMVLDAFDEPGDIVLVARSLGGFTAPLVVSAAPLQALVLVNAMIPVLGETRGDWWSETGAGEARVAALS